MLRGLRPRSPPMTLSIIPPPIPYLPSSSSAAAAATEETEPVRKCARRPIAAPSAVAEASLAECPVCSATLPIARIEQHVDLCLIRGPSVRATASASPVQAPMKRMSKPVYNLLKDSELKRLLQELQLPISGDREQLIRRHSEFLLLYNAECDALRPKSTAQLRAELRALERTWSRRLSPPLPAMVISAGLGGGDEQDDFDQASLSYRTTAPLSHAPIPSSPTPSSSPSLS